MNFKILLFSFFLGLGLSFGQDSLKINNAYRGENEKINDLVHTKLKVAFDYSKRHLIGEAWITLEPHMYNVNTLELDANSMLIHKISSGNKDLKYDYDGKKIKIKLGNTYGKGEEYTVYISYTARPEEVEQGGSAAITSDKGLYFIDPDGTDPEKPTQIWTQGETQANSCWFPTIDSPNQKTSQEIYMTVPDQYVTLSNGLLKKQINNSDGTRTDYWKFDQKHAPYLFFMGVGEFSIINDKWKGIAVDYYVDKEYEPYAQEIFGDTPAMLAFFSDYTGIAYPWPKYAQMVGVDFVSGAMENTTAVLHQEGAYQTSGDLIDENIWESVIAHELFHHWFGDLVTAESWSNITVNESFANYSEYLWFEHKYGRDHADAHRNRDIMGYLYGDNESKDLVRFHYASREDMFDAVSYNKGGAILHMLRDFIGDEAFRAGMNLYLNDNKYGTGEAHQIRLAFEEVSGKDLNWFFNQWYYSNGHPILEVKYIYSEDAKIVSVEIEQTQENLFQFPLAIEVYEGAKKKRYEVWVDEKSKSFSFQYKNKPDLVNVDADRVLLAEINDGKSTKNLVHLYQHGSKYEDRREAIEGLSDQQKDDETAFKTLEEALSDSFYGLRMLAIARIDLSNVNAKTAIKTIEEMALNDDNTVVRAMAISALVPLDNPDYVKIYKESLTSESNAIKVSGLKAIYKLDIEAAHQFALGITSDMDKESLQEALVPIYISYRIEDEIALVGGNLIEGIFFSEDRDLSNTYKEGFQWVANSSNEEATQNLVDSFMEVAKLKSQGGDVVAEQFLSVLLNMKKESSSVNKDALVKIVQDGLDKLK